MDGNPEAAVEVLANVASEPVGRVTTVEDLWIHLQERGIHPKSTETLVSARKTFDELRRRYLQRVSRDLIAGIAIPRAEAALVADAASGGRIVLVQGAAGVGKSSMCASAIAALAARGHEVAVLRMDSIGDAQESYAVVPWPV